MNDSSILDMRAGPATSRAVSYRQRGFTLSELLITLTSGALLFAVGIPSYQTFIMNSLQVTSANELLASFHIARDLAITRNTRVTVCPSASGANCEAVPWNEGSIVFVDANEDRVVDPGEAIERVVEGFTDLSLSSDEFGTFLIYRPSGRVMVNNVRENIGELTLCDMMVAGHGRIVLVGSSGRPRLSKYQADGSAPVCS